jgi:2-methylcitrate dehydratase PrpD
VGAEATLAHVDELDAFHSAAAVLPCATVVPVALAIAREREVNGSQLLAAVAAGSEVIIEAGLRFGAANLYESGWWPTALFGGMGSAMTAALLIGLDADATAHAVGLAAAGLGGLLADTELTDGHYRMIGRAASDGLDAAVCAGAGLRSSLSILDGPAASALGVTARPAGRRRRLHLLDSAVKMYACARPLHAVVEALTVLASAGHDCGQADAVRIAVPSPTLRFVTAERRPRSPAEAAASAACAMDAFLAERVGDPTYFRSFTVAAGPEVRLVRDPDIDQAYPGQWGARVELVSGARAVAGVTVADARRRWPLEQRRMKFNRLVAPHWAARPAQRWASQCLELGQLASTRAWARAVPRP